MALYGVMLMLKGSCSNVPVFVQKECKFIMIAV